MKISYHRSIKNGLWFKDKHMYCDWQNLLLANYNVINGDIEYRTGL